MTFLIKIRTASRIYFFTIMRNLFSSYLKNPYSNLHKVWIEDCRGPSERAPENSNKTSIQTVFVLFFCFVFPGQSNSVPSDSLIPKRDSSVLKEKVADSAPNKLVDRAGKHKPGPFFWQIERDGKQSYILGTFPVGVQFEDLQCYESIQAHISEADFMLREQEERDIEEKDWRTILEHWRKALRQEDQSHYKSFNKEEQAFLQKVYRTRYYFGEERLPPSEYNELTHYSYFHLRGFIESSCLMADLIVDSPASANSDSKNLYFDSENTANNITNLEEQQGSNLSLLEQLEQIFWEQNFLGQNFRQDKSLQGQSSQDQSSQDRSFLVSPLYELAQVFTESIGIQKVTIQKEDIQDWIQNFSSRCSKNSIKNIDNYEQSLITQMIEQFLLGTLNSEIYKSNNRQLSQIGYLESEIKQAEIFQKVYRSWQNQAWYSNIVSAFEQYDNIFIAGNVKHFIESPSYQKTPLYEVELPGTANLREAQGGANFYEAPLNTYKIPSVVDKLIDDGFLVKRMGADCSFEWD